MLYYEDFKSKWQEMKEEQLEEQFKNVLKISQNIVAVTISFERLHRLKIANYDALVSLENILEINKQCPNLTEIIIQNCRLEHGDLYKKKIPSKKTISVQIVEKTMSKWVSSLFSKKQATPPKMQMKTVDDPTNMKIEYYRTLTPFTATAPSNLLYLCLANTNITDQDLSFLLMHCHQLEELRIIDCPILEIAFIKSDSLQRFELNNHKKWIPVRFHDKMPSLVSIVLRNVVCESTLDIFQVVGESKCPNLRELRITGGSMFTYPATGEISYERSLVEVLSISSIIKFSDNQFDSLESIFPNLKELYLNQLSGLRTSGKFVVSSKFPKLTHLEISHCPIHGDAIDFANSDIKFLKLKGRHMETPNITCPSIQSLHLDESSITDECIDNIFFACTTIEELNLSMNKQVRRSPGILSSCTNLKRLDLSYTQSTNVDDERIEEIMGHAKNLQYLSLKMCESLRDPKIFSDALTELALGGTGITDDALQHILHGCPNLTKISLTSCKNLENPRIVHKKLKYLDLSDNQPQFVNTRLLVEMNRAALGNNLRTLIVRWCTGLKLKNGQDLEELFSNLLFLDVTGTPLVHDTNFLNNVQAKNKDLVLVKASDKVDIYTPIISNYPFTYLLNN
jgi:Leucine-rich repeat (LRR) protein